MNSSFPPKKSAWIISLILLCVCLFVGFRLAANKKIWNDELYTQSASVEGLSCREIIAGKVGEGNNMPLFYLIQKGISAALGYSLPEDICVPCGLNDAKGQIVLRFAPIFFMALSIVGIFIYFYLNFSFFIALYSLAISFSSFMLWTYWAEARPYSMVVFLTTLQSIVFLNLMKAKKPEKKLWMALITSNVLLSLTSAISLIQIVSISLLLFIFVERRWYQYIGATIIPGMIILLYYRLAPKYTFWFVDSPLQLIGAAFPKDRLMILLIFALFIFAYYSQHKKRIPIVFKEDMREEACFLSSKGYLLFTCLILAGYGLILLNFKIHEKPGQDGFWISNRYFISLMPIGIFMTTFASIYLVKAQKNKLCQIAVIIILALLLTFRIWRTIKLTGFQLF